MRACPPLAKVLKCMAHYLVSIMTLSVSDLIHPSIGFLRICQDLQLFIRTADSLSMDNHGEASA